MWNVLALFSLASVVEGALKCPANHCLMRKAAGSTSGSFSCEQYPDVGHFCAAENGQCACKGKVKYGNLKSSKTNETWSNETAVDGTITCSNAKFGDPIAGTKGCYCTPSSPAATTRATAAAACDGTGYAAPTCIILDLQTTASGMSSKDVYVLGYNELVANIVIGATWNLHLTTTPTKILTWDESTLTTRLQIPCLNAEHCMGMADASRANPDLLKATTTKFVDANKAALGALASMAPLLKWVFPTIPAENATTANCKLSATTTVTTTTVKKTTVTTTAKPKGNTTKKSKEMTGGNIVSKTTAAPPAAVTYTGSIALKTTATKKEIETAVQSAFAKKFKVDKTKITVTATSARRLSAEERQLATTSKTWNVAFTVIADTKTKAGIDKEIKAFKADTKTLTNAIVAEWYGSTKGLTVSSFAMAVKADEPVTSAASTLSGKVFVAFALLASAFGFH